MCSVQRRPYENMKICVIKWISLFFFSRNVRRSVFDMLNIRIRMFPFFCSALRSNGFTAIHVTNAMTNCTWMGNYLHIKRCINAWQITFRTCKHSRYAPNICYANANIEIRLSYISSSSVSNDSECGEGEKKIRYCDLPSRRKMLNMYIWKWKLEKKMFPFRTFFFIVDRVEWDEKKYFSFNYEYFIWIAWEIYETDKLKTRGIESKELYEFQYCQMWSSINLSPTPYGRTVLDSCAGVDGKHLSNSFFFYMKRQYPGIVTQSSANTYGLKFEWTIPYSAMNEITHLNAW